MTVEQKAAIGWPWGPKEPTTKMLRQMAYELNLVPEGEIVCVQFLEILRNQYKAAMNAALLAAGASEGQAEPVAEMRVARDGRGNTRVTWKTLKWDTSDGLYQLYLHPSAELTALRERIAGMEKDAERLDWLIVNIKRHRLYEHKGNWFCPPVFAQDWQPGHKSARDAIDAAIAKEKA